MKMFDLSRLGYYADFVIVPAIIFGLLMWNMPMGMFLAAVFGFVAWTLVEYVIHRWLFHRMPVLRREHDRHHKDPTGYVAAASAITIPLLMFAWMTCRLLLGNELGDVASIGFLLGYLTYIAVHDQFHHSHIRPGDWLYLAYHRHAVHHRGFEKNYGVIVPWWDIVFKTYRR